MKKVLSFAVLFTVLFAWILCFAVSAESGFKIVITTSEDSHDVISGETFDVTFAVSDITPENGLVGVCFGVEYDASAIQAMSVRSDFPEEWKDAEEFNEIVKNEEDIPVGRLVLGASAEECTPLKKDGYGVTVTFKCLKDGETSVKVNNTDEIFCGVTLIDGKPCEVIGDGCEKTLKIQKSGEDISGNGEESKTETGSSAKYIIIGACAAAVCAAVAVGIIFKRKKR